MAFFMDNYSSVKFLFFIYINVETFRILFHLIGGNPLLLLEKGAARSIGTHHALVPLRYMENRETSHVSHSTYHSQA
jgi:hypothetical protein